MTQDRAPRPFPDPLPIRDAWLSGNWTSASGDVHAGRLWDEDSVYRWERYLDHWFVEHAHDQGEPTPEKIRAWANSLVRADNGHRLSPPSRARAVSVVLSWYDHLERYHDLGPFRLPRRWKIIGVIEPNEPRKYQPWVTDALRTAADRFQGLPPAPGRGLAMQHPSRHRLACYLLLANLRPKQVTHLRLENLAPDEKRKILHAKIPLKHHADDTTVYNGTLPWPIWRTVQDFMTVRRYDDDVTGYDYGPVLTTRSGLPYKWQNFRELIRPIVASDPDLAEIQPPLQPDQLSHSKSPWNDWHLRDDGDLPAVDAQGASRGRGRP
ncbi:hypothetical protein AB0O47_39860 [Streptomyces noursei]|uniref:hypothetical protein n=1 Tax=Streptomyces noursei TaxID=1971 RepID=UPI00344F5C59